MSLYLLPAVAPAALILGFLIGLLTFKVKQRWCPDCGDRLRCVPCLIAAGRLVPLPAQRSQPTTRPSSPPSLSPTSAPGPVPPPAPASDSAEAPASVPAGAAVGAAPGAGLPAASVGSALAAAVAAASRGRGGLAG
ncbi:MAG: hypothetical protein JXA67_10980 [Micromonosporaceae bacterium]|nr:hypothetical protein [Micromonosporaceae bacterium]